MRVLRVWCILGCGSCIPAATPCWLLRVIPFHCYTTLWTTLPLHTCVNLIHPMHSNACRHLLHQEEEVVVAGVRDAAGTVVGVAEVAVVVLVGALQGLYRRVQEQQEATTHQGERLMRAKCPVQPRTNHPFRPIMTAAFPLCITLCVLCAFAGRVSVRSTPLGSSTMASTGSSSSHAGASSSSSSRGAQQQEMEPS